MNIIAKVRTRNVEIKDRVYEQHILHSRAVVQNVSRQQPQVSASIQIRHKRSFNVPLGLVLRRREHERTIRTLSLHDRIQSVHLAGVQSVSNVSATRPWFLEIFLFGDLILGYSREN